MNTNAGTTRTHVDTYDEEIVKPGDRFSSLAREICVASFGNSPAVTVIRAGAGMRAMDGFLWKRPVLESMMDGDIYEVAQSDGAGGKPQFFAFSNTAKAFRELGWEVITMNVDDVACRGGLPVLMLSSNIDVSQITKGNWHLCAALLRGFGAALKESNLILLTGETAVMKHSITAFCNTRAMSQLIMTWSGTCVGLASTRRPPNGSTITPGMTVIGFRDMGYRCNGGTKFTELIRSTWGPRASTMLKNPEARAFVEKLVVPSRSYAQTIARLNGWQLDGSLATPPVKLHGVAHITGGGVWSKFKEILPPGVGAELDSMPPPPDVLLEAQALSMRTKHPMSDYQGYGTFHGGCGLMLVCDEGDVPRVLLEARKDGHDPYVVGQTTSSPEREVAIVSRFGKGGRLSSLDPR